MHYRYETSTLLTFVLTKYNLCWYVHERTDCSYSHHQLSAVMLQEKLLNNET